jgi:oxygen-independent coproporphyrinogen-3 oxidase
VRTAFQQKKRPESWLGAVEATGHGSEVIEPLTQRLECAEELLLMGLRLEEGVWLENFAAAIGAPMTNFLRQERLDPLIEAGLMQMDENRLRATERGRLVLNSLLPEILV